MKPARSINSTILYGIGLLTALGALFFAILNFSEYATVGMEGNFASYSFGCVNENSWYYKTPERYASYCLAAATSFLFCSLLLVFYFFRSSRIGMLMAILITLLLFSLELWSSAIQCE
jgi:hypothetical protein